MLDQLDRLGGLAPNTRFYAARRPPDPAGFPSLGARGCFESHLAVLREAQDAKVSSLLILEDDFDFSREGRSRGEHIISQLFEQEWDLFYGAHLLPAEDRHGLVRITSDVPVLTASFVAVHGQCITSLAAFLEGVLGRPPGSPDYGPMHVDGAYTVYRALNPKRITFAAFPALGTQRSSPSDITPSQMLLDRWRATRYLANMLRRSRNWLARL